MNPDDPRWRGFPVLRELHDQWWTARAGRVGKSERPFSRDWEQLLEDAGLGSAEQRSEAERDVRFLQCAGLIELKPVKYRPHLIGRISIPLEAEHRLAALFGDKISEDESARLDGANWEPELCFLAGAKVSVDPDDLLLLNEFLAQGGRNRPLVPIKERSLQIFGDEKRLNALLATALFQPERLTLEALRCESVGEPLGWQRGPSSRGPVLVIENAATWHSYCRCNKQGGPFSAIVYGKGFVVSESVRYLGEIVAEVGAQRIFYFGDLDPAGLLIPFRASAFAQKCGLPPLEPHFWSYRRLLELGRGKETAWEGDPVARPALSWIGELAEPVEALFAENKRLAQEHVGWEFLADKRLEL